MKTCKYGKVDCFNDGNNHICAGCCDHSLSITNYIKHPATLTDREHLEDLVYICLNQDNPVISIGKGKELLGFRTMNEMRDWMDTYKTS